MEWTYSNIVSISTQAATAIAAGWVFWLRVRKRVISWQKSVMAAEDLVITFGEQPAKEIKRLMDIMAKASDAREVAQNIICHRMGLGIYMCDLTAKCIWANPKLADIFEMGKDEMMGWGWLGNIRRQDQTRVREAWQLAVKEMLPYRETYILRNGNIVETEAFLIHGKSCYVGYAVITGTQEEPKTRTEKE